MMTSAEVSGEAGSVRQKKSESDLEARRQIMLYCNAKVLLAFLLRYSCSGILKLAGVSAFQIAIENARL